MSSHHPSPILIRALICGPVLAFVLLFFFIPIWTVLTQSVSDPVISQNLPHTVAALSGWSGEGPPDETLQTALVNDLRVLTDRQKLGDVVRRLNSVKSGFRSLLGRTSEAITAAEGMPVVLTEIDSRWRETAYWRAIATSAPAITNRFLLEAVDLIHDESGDIIGLDGAASANREAFMRTFMIAATVTLVCFVLGYPYAMLMLVTKGWVRATLLACVLLPLWTSLLVRTAAWYVLLQDQGLISSTLRWFGLIEGPFRLLFTRTGVVVAMSHVLLPLMVLPIYAVLLTIPKNLTPAAASLGAPPLRAFLSVTLPMSVTGVASGVLLVFMSAVGYYITPALIGGPTDQMISSLIAFYATGSANWNMAAAFGVILLAVTLVLYVFYSRVTRDPAQKV